MERRITARAVIIRDNKLFLVKLTDYRYSTQTDFWCTPGGAVEDGETILEALKREIIEELGVEPKTGRLLFVQQYKDDHGEQLEFFFKIENPEDFENIDLSKTTHGELEIAKAQFIDPKDINILPEFLKTEDLATAVDTQAVKFFSAL